MKIGLEITGGFTGAAGKQVITLDSDSLPESDAAELCREVNLVPIAAWGSTFLNPHPKPWDFRHVLRIEEAGNVRQITFHRNQGPAALTRLADKIPNLGSS